MRLRRDIEFPLRFDKKASPLRLITKGFSTEIDNKGASPLRLIIGFYTRLALQKGLDKGNSLDNGRFRQYNSLGNWTIR
jgi:hypothetical protein